jgi:hypothetical protein
MADFAGEDDLGKLAEILKQEVHAIVGPRTISSNSQGCICVGNVLRLLAEPGIYAFGLVEVYRLVAELETKHDFEVAEKCTGQFGSDVLVDLEKCGLEVDMPMHKLESRQPRDNFLVYVLTSSTYRSCAMNGW